MGGQGGELSSITLGTIAATVPRVGRAFPHCPHFFIVALEEDGMEICVLFYAGKVQGIET